MIPIDQQTGSTEDHGTAFSVRMVGLHAAKLSTPLQSAFPIVTNNTLGSLVLMLTRDDETVQKKSAYDTFEFERICQVLNSDFKYAAAA